MIRLKIRGDKELRSKIRKFLRAGKDDYTITIFARSSAERSAKENADIARIQASYGRNPFFLDKNERSWLVGDFKDRLVKSIQGGRLSLGPLGKRVLETVKLHIEGGNSENGRMRDLSPRYKEQKKKKFGQITPILIASKQFYKSLSYKVGR